MSRSSSVSVKEGERKEQNSSRVNPLIGKSDELTQNVKCSKCFKCKFLK